MSLFANPPAAALRPGEVLVWSGKPHWRTLATRVFHIGAVSMYLSALVFANALAARMQHLSAMDTLHGVAPVLALLAGGVAFVAFLAWATGRTTLYSVTNQRVVMQYGVAIEATLSLPMRLIRSVAVSDKAIGDVLITMKPGNKISLARLWPHARPWRITQPEPMLRALPGVAPVAALIARAVAEAQSIEWQVPAPGMQPSQAAAPARELMPSM